MWQQREGYEWAMVESVWESACEHVVGQGYKVFSTLSLLCPRTQQ